MKEQLKRYFEEIGVPALVAYVRPHIQSSVDVLRDDLGEFFDIQCWEKTPPRVLDSDPDDRHLLLGFGEQWYEQSVFLCGHDERYWFAAAIPASARAKDIAAAKDALKPQEVWDALRERNVPAEARNLRKTAAFVRQGEWFFIPRPGLAFSAEEVVGNAPLSRNAGKPHMCEFMHEAELPPLYVNRWHRNGLTMDKVQALPPNERHDQWRRVVRKPRIHVRGAVKHPDHATVFLRSWHQVAMNTESDALAMQVASQWSVRFPVLRFRD